MLRLLHMSKLQFKEDSPQGIHGFYRKGVLVECPRCQRMAYILPANTVDAQIACDSCGYAKEYTGRSTWIGGAESRLGVEHYSQCQLWLQVRCCGQRLWALNREHVEWLDQYVGAELRSRNVVDGCVNSSLQSRVPKWISSKKNRKQVLSGIQKLKARLI